MRFSVPALPNRKHQQSQKTISIPLRAFSHDFLPSMRYAYILMKIDEKVNTWYISG